MADNCKWRQFCQEIADELADIVRCKDCIHYYTFACRMINPKETDFCNYGEKMPNLKCSSLTRKGERK